ncbi:hypothetical protein VX037_12355 [Gordonia sp. Z-3]|uniref:hypothetical protein n=1 Tax=Gordonia sp. Z-3 TaxID=3115408 RepID=UPI002E27D1E8|nr:hypothetical protein [Gordonia sp. Z-3]MED5801820.1 hypothetical protein [Gordonia sp. Z-3]
MAIAWVASTPSRTSPRGIRPGGLIRLDTGVQNLLLTARSLGLGATLTAAL